MALSREDEQALIARWQQGKDNEARRELVLANLISIKVAMRPYALRFRDRYEDVFGDAVEGFLSGIDHYDPSKGVRLWTYARAWVRNSLQNASIGYEHSTSGRKAAEARAYRTRWARDRRGTGEPLGEPTDDQQRLSLIFAGRADIDDGAPTIGDALVYDGPSPEESAAESELKSMVASAIFRLPSRHATVLRGRYFEDKSDSAIAVALRCRVADIEPLHAEALSMVRRLLDNEDPR